MKLSILLLSTLCAILLTQSCGAQQTTCQADYQCGTIPYGYCDGSIDDCPTTNPGIAVDESNNAVYFISRCRNIKREGTYNGVDANYTIKRVSVSGSVPTTVYTESVIPAAGNLDKIYAIVNGNIYFDRAQRQPGNALITLNSFSKQQNYVQINPGFFQNQLDITENSYSCQLSYVGGYYYGIYRYSGAVTSGSSGNLLFNLSNVPCGPVKRANANNIIFTTQTYRYDENTGVGQYNTTFYSGNVVGSKTLPSPLFVIYALVNDFDVDSNGVIYYGTASGLFRRSGATTTTISSEGVVGVYVYGQKVIYNTGSTIRSVNTDGSSVATLVLPQTGKCTCRPNFSGNNCQTCNGSLQFSDGVPSCVPINSNGDPERCTADYQCSSQPFKVCAGSCICRRNFTGPKCDQCPAPYSFTYQNGVPTCQ